MPTIDVSYLVNDAAFAEPITVIRRMESVGADGVSMQTSSEHNINATVTAGAQPQLERSSGGQWLPNTITVHTAFRLIGPALGYQPDVVLWSGRRYLVTRTYDYSRYGNGFVRADCHALDFQDSL